MTNSREKGGLVILIARNISYLGKWLWKLTLERESLCMRESESKYGYHDNG